MPIVRIIAFLFGLTISSFSYATKCMIPGTLEDLKKRHPILIKGQVEERKLSSVDKNSVELTVSVIQVLNGKLTTKSLRGWEYHRPSPFPVKREHTLKKTYIFSVSYQKKDKAFVLQTQPDGCPDLVLENQNNL